MTLDRLLLTGGTVVDGGGERRLDVRIADGVIVEIGVALDADPALERVLDAQGCIVGPGFVDLHTHLREPGMTEAETIATGSAAAALGGYTAVVAMPNTDPTQDCVEVVEFVRNRGREVGLCDVRPSGSITIGRAGVQLTPFSELAAVGVHLFTDDGSGVQDAGLMRRALEYAGELGLLLAQHCEVAAMTHGAVMHEGDCCSHLGLPGWPALAEELMVHRDIELCRLTGSPVHLLHLSTARSVELVRAAKADGLPVTAEATPHHISLTDEALRAFDARFKVNPPLRTMADVEAVRRGLLDGAIDAVATDHAPHPAHAKERPLDEAPPGMLGLETALGVTRKVLDTNWQKLFELLSTGPARIAGLAEAHGRPVEVGEPANLVVIDPDVDWEVDPGGLASLSNNTPYIGMGLRSRVRHTIFHGRAVVIDRKVNR
ncbi:MAG: dihydroorotase [Ilumatobacteraceae bacterium]